MKPEINPGTTLLSYYFLLDPRPYETIAPAVTETFEFGWLVGFFFY